VFNPSSCWRFRSAGSVISTKSNEALPCLIGLCLLVCIDISKDKFNACAISNPNSIIFEMFAHGLSSFTNKLSPFTKSSIIAMESAVCYYFNLFSFLLANNFTCVVLSLWHQMMVTKNGSIPIRTTQSSHPKVWLQQHLQKRPRQVLFKNINHLLASLGKNMCESNFSLLKDFFQLKRGPKSLKNLTLSVHGFCAVKNL